MGFLGFDNLDDDTLNQGLAATGSSYRMQPHQGAPPAAPAPAAPAAPPPTATQPLVQATDTEVAAPPQPDPPPAKEKDKGFDILGLVTSLFGL